MDIEPTDKAIDAAWKAFWGDHHQVEKADMKAAIAAAINELMLVVWDEAVEKAAQKADETHDAYDLNNEYCRGICDASMGIAVWIRKMKKRS